MNAMPTSTAPPRRSGSARHAIGCRRDRHRARHTRSSQSRHVVLARYYDPAIGRFTAVDPIVSAVGSLDRFGYGLGSPVTLKDPSGLRVPVGNGNDPDSGGSYHADWQLMYGSNPYRPTKVRMPGVKHEYSGWTDAGLIVRSPVNSDYPVDPVDRGVLARRFIESRQDPLVFSGLGNCSVVDIEGCAWVGTLLTWDELAEAYLDVASLSDSTIEGGTLYKAVSWAHQHLGGSYGVCVGICFNITYNNGHVSGGVTGVGLMSPGAGLTYHSQPVNEQSNTANGAGYAVGVGGSVSVTEEGAVNATVYVSPTIGGFVEVGCACVTVDLFGWWTG